MGRIRELIESTGVPITEVARRLKKSRNAIYEWDKEDKDIKYNLVKSVLRIADSENIKYDVKEEFSIEEFHQMKEELKGIKAEMFDLQRSIKTKDQKIEELQAEVVRLSVENTTLGEMLGGKSKLNG